MKSPPLGSSPFLISGLLSFICSTPPLLGLQEFWTAAVGATHIAWAFLQAPPSAGAALALSHHFGRMSCPRRGSQVVLVVKNLPPDTGDIREWSSIPGPGRSSGGGCGNPLQYSCLENPMDRGAGRAAVHRVTQGQTRLKRPALACLPEGGFLLSWVPLPPLCCVQAVAQYSWHSQLSSDVSEFVRSLPQIWAEEGRNPTYGTSLKLTCLPHPSGKDVVGFPTSLPVPSIIR